MKIQDFLEYVQTNTIVLDDKETFNFENLSFGQKLILKDQIYFYLNKGSFEYGAEHHFVCTLSYRKNPDIQNFSNCDIDMFLLRDFGSLGFDIQSFTSY